jgi:hypothetical protein
MRVTFKAIILNADLGYRCNGWAWNTGAVDATQILEEHLEGLERATSRGTSRGAGIGVKLWDPSGSDHGRFGPLVYALFREAIVWVVILGRSDGPENQS